MLGERTGKTVARGDVSAHEAEARSAAVEEGTLQPQLLAVDGREFARAEAVEVVSCERSDVCVELE